MIVSKKKKEAILFISHGSRSRKSREENIRMAEIIKKKTGCPVVEYAFLDADQPDIAAGIRLCVEKGASKITVLLNFLNSGRHAESDIPAILERERRNYPHLKIILTPPVGTHPRLPELFLDMVRRTRPRKKASEPSSGKESKQ